MTKDPEVTDDLETPENEGEEPEVTENPDEDADDGLTDDQRSASEHGWTALEDFLDKGGDEDDYVGAKAFLKNYESIKKNRSQDTEIKSLHSKLDNVGNAVAAQLKAVQETARREIKAELASAKEDEDFDRYDKANTALTELEAQEPPDESSEPAKPQVILDFVAKHPQLDETSPDYDPGMVGMVNQFITEGAREIGRDLAKQPPTDFEMKTILENAISTAEDRLSGSPKGKRKAPAIQGKGKGSQKPAGKLDLIQQSVYDHLKENQSDGAAEAFKKSTLEAAA